MMASVVTAQDSAIADEINRHLPQHAKVWISRLETRDGKVVHECIFEYGYMRHYDSAPQPFYDVDEIVAKFGRWFEGAQHRKYLSAWVDFPDDADDLSGAPWND